MDGEGALNKVDSEIALTALLSAGVLGYPSPDMSMYPLVRVAAFGLLLLTMVRRTGIMNGLTGDDNVIKATTHLMDLGTNISFLYLSYTLTRWMTNEVLLSSEPSALLFGAGTAAVIFVIFLIFELLFGSALREGERVFSATARKHRGEALGAVLSQVATFVAIRRPEKTTRQAKLGRFYDRTVEDYSQEEQMKMVKSFVIMFLSIVTVFVAYGLVVKFGIYVFDVGWLPILLLLLSVMLVSAFFRLWYSNYGLIQVEDRNGFITYMINVATFLVISQMVI